MNVPLTFEFMHQTTHPSFARVISVMKNHVHPLTKTPAPLVSDAFYDVVMANAEMLDNAIDHDMDFTYDYCGYKTLERSLVKLDGKLLERPQHLLMRVALAIHLPDLPLAIASYKLMSERYFTHAAPTLFNAGAPRPQLSSCFLLAMKEDSIEGIYDTLKQCAMISKLGGGIGLSVHSIRATNSYVAGSNGLSNGLVPMLRVFNNTARYISRGGGGAKGSYAVYLEPWHADLLAFLDLKKRTGNELDRARDLFFALWVPDLFMERVDKGMDWTLMCPNECPGLADCHGEEFKKLYEKYEELGKGRTTVKAQSIWTAILTSQAETGTPCIMYKDACNLKSNQRHLGTIKSSSLNMEIVEYTSPDEVAASTVASINLARMVSGGGLDVGMHADLSQPPTFDYNKLKEVTKHVTKNLNKVIDISYYPVVEATNSNVRHRPIGIGVQGLADAFSKMGHPFESASARQMNKDIFETIYFGACEASCEIAARDGPYSTYEGSPASKGELQFDLWAVAPSKRWDWSLLKEKIARHGLRNSLLTAGVSDPGAARILGCTPTTNPSTSDTCGSRDPARDLASVEAVSRPPSEISGRILVDLAADRGPYICHSQCLRIPRKEQLPLTLAALHFRAWRAGLKAGVSCTRTPSPTTPSPAAAALAREGSCTDDSLSVRAG